MRDRASAPVTVRVSVDAASCFTADFVFTGNDQSAIVDGALFASGAVAISLSGQRGSIQIGEGAAVPLRSPSDRPRSFEMRPSREGRLRVVFQPRAKGQEDKRPFGTRMRVYDSGYAWVTHSVNPVHIEDNLISGVNVGVVIGN